MIPVTDTTRRRIGYVVVATAIASILTFVIVSLSMGDTGGVVEQVFLGAVFGTVMVLAVRAAPRNGAVWALVWGAFCGAWSNTLNTLALQRTGFSQEQIENGALAVAPASLDWLTAMVINLGEWLWIGYFLLPIHLVLLFPTGRASSRMWRRAMWLAAVVMVGNAVIAFVSLGPWVETPYDQIFAGSALPAVGYANLILLLLVPFSVGNLIVRFRRSTGVERLQFRWLTWAVAVLAVTLLSGIVLNPLGLEDAVSDVQGVISTLALAGIPISIGIAITKYRLYDIDVVISRSLVFAALVGFITLVYAVVVVGVGSLVGGSGIGWSTAATALVAVLFEPVRDRVHRWVNRLVYGRRATPYEVLSDLTGRLAATESDEGLLDRMAQRLADGTGADRAVVWIRDGTGFRAAACEPSGLRPPDVSGDLDALPGTVVPIDHDGDSLGALSVETRRGDTLTPTEQRLVENLAGSAGLVMRRLRLDAALEQKAAELEQSRRRLLDAQDVERRRLERALDEGPQQQVVALKLALDLAARQATQEGSDTTAGFVAQMAADTQDAIDQIRALAHGIYPPLLETGGLAAAIPTLADQAPIETRVTVDIHRRHGLAREAAIYFCVSEALTNTAKYGEGPVTVTVTDADSTLRFQVTDAGPGFDPASIHRGAGLTNITDRLDALDGTATINSAPGHPTSITGQVAVAVESPA